MKKKDSMHYHLCWMLDLETLDTKVTSVITEIALVGFDIATGEIIQEMSIHLYMDEQIALGRTISGNTLAWWLDQPSISRDKLKLSVKDWCENNCKSKPLPLRYALKTISEFITNKSTQWQQEHNRKYGNKYSTSPLIFGNGIQFDIGKLTNLYSSLGKDVPWEYWAERDVRTLVDFRPDIKERIIKDFQGIKHYGLDDCKNQIRYVVEIYNDLIAEKSNC